MSELVPMTIRWPPVLHAAIVRLAEQRGVPVAQYVRECVLVQGAWEAGIEAGRIEQPPPAAQVEQLREQAHQMLSDLIANNTR
jgi:hypothetical protein